MQTLNTNFTRWDDLTEAEQLAISGALVAESKQRQARDAKRTREEVEADQRRRDLEQKHWLRLSTPKREQGYGDASAELAEAQRLAAAEVVASPKPALVTKTLAPMAVSTAKAPRRTNGRSGRPASTTTSSSRSRGGDSGDDPPDDLDPSLYQSPGWARLADGTWWLLRCERIREFVLARFAAIAASEEPEQLSLEDEGRRQ